jgi:hypothetical protein
MHPYQDFSFAFGFSVVNFSRQFQFSVAHFLRPKNTLDDTCDGQRELRQDT